MKVKFVAILLGAMFSMSLWLVAEDSLPSSLKVHPMFSDGMVLQRGMAVKIWGTARPESEVMVKFTGQKKKAKCDANGKWMVVLDPMKESSKPAILEISCDNGNARFENVLVGDVWVCSGQSNMEWAVVNSLNAQEEIKEAAYPEIRLFTVVKNPSGTPVDSLQGEWKVCSPKTVGRFSAVGYFFGRELHKDIQIPIGLINASWGGTPAEAWTSLETLDADPDLSHLSKKYRDDVAKSAQKINISCQFCMKDGRWIDPGNKGFDLGYASENFDDTGWKTMNLPCLWESVMDIDGAVWFRKEIDLSPDWAGKDITLSLGAIDDFDITYFNGEIVGRMGAETPDSWITPRKYEVSGKLVKAGKNVVAIRVFDNLGSGGFMGSAKDMRIANAKASKDISGTWNYFVELEFLPAMKPNAPLSPKSQNSPSTLYNGMIHPIMPYAIKGAIWYQGESNAGKAYQYRKLLPAMIQCWRTNWGQDDFPFLIVQLANFKSSAEKPEESEWAELREAQAMTGFGVENCGLAVTIDIGESKDIHPRNKQDVGKRLVVAALKVAYGKNIVFSGPTYHSMRVANGKIVLNFQNIGGGLIASGGRLRHFAIAGDDRVFRWAKAEIDGESVIVSSDDVANPVAVRYAWANNPEGCNLYNKQGLPAVPFRTDNWPGITINKR